VEEKKVVQEINLYDLLKFYAKNWLILLSAVFVGAIIGLVYTFFIQTPLYKSEATLLVVGARTSPDGIINNNYTELFKSRRVLDPVIQSTGYNGDYSQLFDNTTTTNNKDTDVIRISMATTDAQKSQELLRASLDSFKTEANALYNSDNIQVVDSASAPTDPFNVRTTLQVGLATIASLLAAIIVIFFIYDYNLSQQTAGKTAGAPVKKTTKKSKGSKKSKKQTSKRGKTFNSRWKSFVKKFENFFKTSKTPMPKAAKKIVKE
jgi:capsular polysaccharide biosynthesis protein